MVKYRLFFKNFKKEEDWINNIIKKGYQLIKVNPKVGRYEFTPHNEEYHLVSIDYRTFNDTREFINYVSMFEDSGWKHITGSEKSGIQYFQQTTDISSHSIFSDIDSKAGIYKRLANNYMCILTAYLPFFVALQMTNDFSIDGILHWKGYYYTPGLWEMEGGNFIFSFLFETPFALWRSCGGLILYIVLFCLFIFYVRSYFQYRKECRRL